MTRRIGELAGAELDRLVRTTELDTGDLLEVLRNPYCTPEIAARIADAPGWRHAHAVRELLAGFRGLPLGKALDLLATLPWTSLLRLAQEPKAPPVVRRHAEKKLLGRLPKLTLGERIALARRAHRPILRSLLGSRDAEVLEALLDNFRMVENDVLLMIHVAGIGARGVLPTIARHHRWGSCHAVRQAIARCPYAPLPTALAALVQLSSGDVRRLLRSPELSQALRAACWELLVKRRRAGQLNGRMSGYDRLGGFADSPEGVR
jgi:hypothetical protein